MRLAPGRYQPYVGRVNAGTEQGAQHGETDSALPSLNDIFFSRRALERFAQARRWAGPVYKWRKGVRKRAKSFGAVTLDAPAWVRAAGAPLEAEAFLSVGPHVFPLVRNALELGGREKPWVAITCFTEAGFVPEPPKRTASAQAPRPTSAADVVPGLELTSHAVEQYRDRVVPGEDVVAAKASLRSSLAAHSTVLSAEAPQWMLTPLAETAGFLIANPRSAAELCVPFVWDGAEKRQQWVAVTCVGKTWAGPEDAPEHEAAQLLAETNLPRHVVGKYAAAHGITSLARAQARLARSLRSNGRAARVAPEWAPLPTADCYLVVDGDVALALDYNGASDERPLVATALAVPPSEPHLPSGSGQAHP